MEARITVIMSVYNGEKYLREAIDSILGQTFKDFEFLIIDDGSTDSSVEIIRSYTDPRIRLIQNGKNIGLTRSLNKGIKLARGEYIARMDADDISLPERIEKQIEYLDYHPDVGVLGTRFFEIDKNGNVRREIYVPLSKRNIERQLYTINCFCHSSVMMRRSCIEKVGLYDETIKYAQDYELWLRMIDVCQLENHPELLHKWRYNTRTGISVKKSYEQNKNAEEIREKHIKRKLKANLIDYKYLTQLVRANPNDKLIASLFFQDYEKSKNHDLAEQLTCLQLKYLHENKKWAYLNEIGKIYKEQNKQHVAFMCFVESLRLKPEQPDIFALAESLKESVKPVIPAKLKGNNCAVSVIMATYNRPESIGESIQSVLNQTFQDFELIVINDGGTDEVRKVIDSLNSNKIKYYRLDKNCGHTTALNEGILQANGKYIAYLDDDDIYYPKHLEIVVNFLERNPDYDFVYLNSWWRYGEISNNRFIGHYRKLNKIRPQKFDKTLLFENNYISTLNILHKKECFTKVGIFNTDLAHLYDWDLWKRYARYFKFYQLDEITGEYRWTQNNMSIANKLSDQFFYRITKAYHQFNCGDIALLKSYLKTGRTKEAEELLNKVMFDYDDDIKTSKYIEEVFFLHPYLRNDNNKQFIQKVTRDFFKYHPKRCLREIVHVKSTPMLFSIIPLLPLLVLKIMKILKCRTMNYRKILVSFALTQ